MSILVTGATGFIGNHVVRALLAAGENVIATSSNAGKAQDFPWFKEVTYIPFDILQSGPDTHSLLGRPESVIHLAWDSLSDFRSARHVNEIMPAHLQFLQHLVSGGTRICVVAGTCLEYGLKQGALKENSSADPIIAYAKAKNTLRLALEKIQQTRPFDLRWMRVFYLYGEGQSSKSILAQLDHALDEGKTVFDMSAGQQLRDYLPVEKVADIITAVAGLASFNGTLNCCSGKPISIEALVRQHLRRRRKHIELNLGHYPYPDYEPMEFWGERSKLDQALGISHSPFSGIPRG